MAGGKNQVTLTFAGDSSDLERSMGKVGSSSKTMGKDAASGFDKVGESADNLDTRAMGFRDTLTGVEDTGRGVSEIMKGNLFEGTLLLGMGFGDLASGVANFGVQFAKQAGQFVANTAKMVASQGVAVAKMVAGWVLMGVQAMLNAAKMAVAWLISLGPIGLLIAAVGLVIAILVSLGVGFDDLKRWAQTAWEFILGAIKGAFNWVKDNWPTILAILTGPIGIAVLLIVKHWDTIKEKVGAVLDWIKGAVTGVKDWIVARFNDVVSFITGLPGRIKAAASGMWNGLKDSFKSAINSIVGWWNGLSFTLPVINIPSWDPPGPGPTFGGGSVGGQTFSTPNLPYLHTGGVYRAPPGQREGMAMLLDGERVLPPGQSGQQGGVTAVNVYVQGSIRSDRDLVKVIRDEFARGGFAGVM